MLQVRHQESRADFAARLETEAGDVWMASPIDLTCGPVARSLQELETLFADPDWAQSRLLTDVALLARDQAVERPHRQVFAIAPHPSITGSITTDNLMPMDVAVWHHIALQLRAGPQNSHD
jgi:hypothetical protein